jgi:BirA family transcriptional regulator, biotin operon repressor / biotin---[acetyl-CoA-carboxylase] ligase
MLTLPSFSPNNILMLSEIESTNSYAIAGLNGGTLSHGDVVQAQHQLAGRGQRANSWQNQSGKDLLMSVILQPQLRGAHNTFLLSMACSVAMSTLLSKYCTDVRIKWSNDIYCGARKIAGILIENCWRGEHWQSSVIGIGLNVNSNVQHAGLNAISMLEHTKKEHDITLLRNELLDLLSETIEACNADAAQVVADYNASLYGLGAASQYLINGTVHDAITRRVERSGELVLEIGGVQQSFMYGQAQLVVAKP